jgi:hypothetical protein
VSLLEGFWEGVDMRRVVRISTTFQLSNKLSVNSVIGREAHINFVESKEVAVWLALTLDGVWESPAPIRAASVPAAVAPSASSGNGSVPCCSATEFEIGTAVLRPPPTESFSAW